MILTKQVQVAWAPSTKKHYESLGYKFTKNGDNLFINPVELPVNSHHKIKVQCDECGEIKETQYRYYRNNCEINNNEKYLCANCMAKREEMLKNKVEKTKQTNLKRYGVEGVGSLPEVREKMKQTCLKKYGVEYVTQSEFYKQKFRQTMQNKYGVNTPLEVKEFLEKAQNTCQEHYGVKIPTQSKEITEKIKATNLEKYGVETALQNQEILQKAKNTTKEHFGVEFSLASKIVRKKGEETLLKRYGVKNPAQSPLIQAKIKKTLFKYDKVRTSKQQKQIFEILSNIYGKVELNFPLGKYSLDCCIKVDDINIDIEYDGWYWHRFSQKDKERDAYVISQGYKVIRIRAGHSIPTKDELNELIEQITKEDLNFLEKIYPEWENQQQKKELKIVN